MITSTLDAMTLDLKTTYDRLYAYCANRDFAGHDPFDGLNSDVFQKLPIKNLRIARLAFLQIVKRFPVDLRPFLQVREGVNPKAIALFALAEMARFRKSGNFRHYENTRILLNRLLELKIAGEATSGESWSAFGYNFDWQSRYFFAPRGTPAIVPTAFASAAFEEASHLFDDERYADAVTEIAAFVVHKLNRFIETADEVCFSYTPLDSSVIYNASLLAGECLARAAKFSDNSGYSQLAEKALRFVVRRQRADGAWVYGASGKQAWVDNFHTAYVLLSIRRITDALCLQDDDVESAFDRGLDYWLANFFLDDGTPKYYNEEVYPIDIHSAAVAIVAMSELGETANAGRVAAWTCANMLDEHGYFYYQQRANGLVETPYMRWGQGWMCYALARLIEAENL
ncbi:MAG: hypothetical protein ACKVQW_16940 [Pyrinomonadaceae bacterium]